MSLIGAFTKHRTTFDTWQCHVHLNDGRYMEIKKAGGFSADPFFLNEYTVIFEYYSFKESRGWIEAIDLRTGGIYKIFDNGVHSSFPYVFIHKHQIYVMPEQRQLLLLEAFPVIFDTVGRAVLREEGVIRICAGVPIVDAMTLNCNGKLLCLYNEDLGNIGDAGGTLMLGNIELGSATLNAEEAILLSSDFRYSRNAGMTWFKNGALYRIFQKKNPGEYGNGIGLDRVRLNLRGEVQDSLQKIRSPKFIRKHQLDVISHHLDIKCFGKVWDART